MYGLQNLFDIVSSGGIEITREKTDSGTVFIATWSAFDHVEQELWQAKGYGSTIKEALMRLADDQEPAGTTPTEE